MVQTGNAVMPFLVMSNELSTPKLLCCPNDRERVTATTFGGLSNSNISYFTGADVRRDDDARLILSGDSNFEIGGKPVKSGLLSVWTNDPIAWTTSRHKGAGYVGFADGSAQQEDKASLQSCFTRTGIATNRLAIP